MLNPIRSEAEAFRALVYVIIAAVVIIAIIVTHAVIHSWLLWLVVGGLAFVWLRGEEHRRRR